MSSEWAGPRYYLTPTALRDLEDLWDFIAEDNPTAASEVVQTILAAADRLAEFPRIGHPRVDLADETLRVWPVNSYLIIYRPDQEPIEIIRIISGFRDLSALLPDERNPR